MEVIRPRIPEAFPEELLLELDELDELLLEELEDDEDDEDELLLEELLLLPPPPLLGGLVFLPNALASSDVKSSAAATPKMIFLFTSFPPSVFCTQRGVRMSERKSENLNEELLLDSYIHDQVERANSSAISRS